MAISVYVTDDEMYDIKKNRGVTIYAGNNIKYDLNTNDKIFYVRLMGLTLFYMPYDRIEIRDHHKVECVTVIYNGIDLINFHT